MSELTTRELAEEIGQGVYERWIEPLEDRLREAEMLMRELVLDDPDAGKWGFNTARHRETVLAIRSFLEGGEQ